MSTDFDQRIEAAFVAADRKIQELRESKLAEYEALQRRLEQAEKARQQLARDVVRPRIKKLCAHFPNAELLEKEDPRACHCTVRFQHTPRFPATVTLLVGVAYDAEVRNVLLIYDLEILPVFLEYERKDQLALPVDNVDVERASRWIEDRLVRFVEDYLKLEFADQYQRDNLVTDPVANIRISRLIAQGEAESSGDTYYFLTKENEAAFRANPAAYVRPSRRQ